MADLSGLVDRWLTWLDDERGLLPNTLNAYGREVRALEDSSTTPLVKMTTDDLRAYLSLRRGAPATRARRLAALTSFYKYVVSILQLRDDDPTVRLSRPKVRRGLPKPIKDKGAVLAKLEPVDQLIAIFLGETGLRISEACSVNVSTPVGDVITVVGKGAKPRLVPLTPLARTTLDWMGGAMPPRRSVRTIQRRFKAAGVTPHRWRHTLGTELAEGGADLGDIQELLGHESPATTRVYTQFNLDRLRSAQARRAS